MGHISTLLFRGLQHVSESSGSLLQSEERHPETEAGEDDGEVTEEEEVTEEREEEADNAEEEVAEL